MRIFFFGFGYCARRFIALDQSIEASGATRSDESVAALGAEGIAAHRFDGAPQDGGLAADLDRAEAIVVSIPPEPGGDAALIHFGEQIASAPNLRRVVYLSSIGVYGDHGGRWVDETSATLAGTARGRARLEAEALWLALGAKRRVAVDILRLAGIYGPGATRWSNCARVARAASSSRATSSIAPMSTMSRRRCGSCWPPTA